LTFGGYPPFHVEAGAMIVAPTRSVHALAGEACAIPSSVRHCRPLDAGLAELGRHLGEVSTGIAVACGSVDATYRGLDSIFEYLPEPIMVQSRVGDPIWRNFELILQELTAPRAGSNAMLRLLFQQNFIEFLREHGQSEDCQLPWLLALDKPRFGRAIEDIINNPEKSYTLESLATKCAMSRSTFASQFADAFGRSAMDFVKEVRMRTASRLLVHTDLPVKSIASQVGYDSRSHFSRTFHEFFSLSPAEYRDQNINQGTS
jgi:AraC-like DNA-binding protein